MVIGATPGWLVLHEHDVSRPHWLSMQPVQECRKVPTAGPTHVGMTLAHERGFWQESVPEESCTVHPPHALYEKLAAATGPDGPAHVQLDRMPLPESTHPVQEPENEPMAGPLHSIEHKLHWSFPLALLSCWSIHVE